MAAHPVSIPRLSSDEIFKTYSKELLKATAPGYSATETNPGDDVDIEKLAWVVDHLTRNNPDETLKKAVVSRMDDTTLRNVMEKNGLLRAKGNEKLALRLPFRTLVENLDTEEKEAVKVMLWRRFLETVADNMYTDTYTWPKNVKSEVKDNHLRHRCASMVQSLEASSKQHLVEAVEALLRTKFTRDEADDNYFMRMRKEEVCLYLGRMIAILEADTDQTLSKCGALITKLETETKDYRRRTDSSSSNSNRWIPSRKSANDSLVEWRREYESLTRGLQDFKQQARCKDPDQPCQSVNRLISLHDALTRFKNNCRQNLKQLRGLTLQAMRRDHEPLTWNQTFSERWANARSKFN